jgi:hypothetical protein
LHLSHLDDAKTMFFEGIFLRSAINSKFSCIRCILSICRHSFIITYSLNLKSQIVRSMRSAGYHIIHRFYQRMSEAKFAAEKQVILLVKITRVILSSLTLGMPKTATVWLEQNRLVSLLFGKEKVHASIGFAAIFIVNKCIFLVIKKSASENFLWIC